ncbi:MAG: DUF1772 domain-containing protein [Candidatus Zixiibacteriota bacterium]
MLTTVTSLVALLSTGLLAGIFLGHRLGTSFALPQVPDSSFVRFQQEIHIRYVKFMPVLQILSILGNLIWLLLLRTAPAAPKFILLALVTIGSIAVFAITLTVNVPINKKLMTWNSATPPSNVREIWRPWEKGNTVRTILMSAVFALQVVVVSLAM